VAGFWSDYGKSLKPLAVEEPIDVYVHRPLAYVLAKVLYPTPVSPNAITLGSILFGSTAGYSFCVEYDHHMQVGAACLFSSAVLDCTDGQLARLRKTASAFGRMLDGVADFVSIGAAVIGVAYHLWRGYGDPTWLGALIMLFLAITVVTGSFHTSSYDHYKNVYLRLTTPAFHEGEDYESALERYRSEARYERRIWARIAWLVYLFYVKSQRDYVARFDPHTCLRLESLPTFDERTAEIYRMHAEAPMRVWRAWFGMGSLVFGVAVAAFFDVILVYLAARLVAQNALFYGWLRPAQRVASRSAFEAMGLSTGTSLSAS
jgi:phosphatidylglycerophosphate synthase